jgi:hypothetical protein
MNILYMLQERKRVQIVQEAQAVQVVLIVHRELAALELQMDPMLQVI